MVYQMHLRHVVRALLGARPDISTAEICERAGLGKNWIRSFLESGRATFSSAHKVLRVARELCPADEAGAELRALLVSADELIGRLPEADNREHAA